MLRSAGSLVLTVLHAYTAQPSCAGAAIYNAAINGDGTAQLRTSMQRQGKGKGKVTRLLRWLAAKANTKAIYANRHNSCDSERACPRAGHRLSPWPAARTDADVTE
jgi:hypothetical protein